MSEPAGPARLRVRDVDGVRWISFDRPAELNALRLPDIQAATAAVTEVDAPGGARSSGMTGRRAARELRAIVFTGTGGRAFSTGMHIDSFVGLDPSGARSLIGALAELVGAVRRVGVATVACVRGYCLGAAFELALACDIRVAATDAVFGLPEIKLGIPSVIDAALLQQHVGLAKAKEMILTGDLYDATELDRHGLLNVVAAPDRVEDEAARAAARMTGHTRTALAAQKRLFELWQNVGLQAAVDGSVEVFAEVFGEDETGRQIEAYRARHASRKRASRPAPPA